MKTRLLQLAATCLLLASLSSAQVIYSGPINGGTGQPYDSFSHFYLDLDSLTFSSSLEATSDYEFYGNSVAGVGSNQYLYTSSPLSGAASVTAGTLIDASLPSAVSGYWTSGPGILRNFVTGESGYLALKTDEGTYAWIQIMADSSTSGALLEIAADVSGSGITAGAAAIPEPATVALITACAALAGTVFVRRFNVSRKYTS